MKEKIFRGILVVILIISLLSVDFLILGINVATAAYESLEEQENNSNSENIQFDAYLKTGDEIIHSKELAISSQENLYINLNVKNAGILTEAKIKIENANFKISKERATSKYIKEINEEENEITLNQIAYGDSIEIEVPIDFEKSSEIDSDYFNRENTIYLTAKYKDETSEESITGQVKTRILWTEEAKIEINRDIEKYFSLSTGGTLLQEALNIEVKDNVLPKQIETVEIIAPVMEEQNPKSVVILRNGNKLDINTDYTYDSEKGLLNITVQNSINSQNKIVWGNGKDEYKIIYLYDDTVKDDDRIIQLNAKATVQLYTKDGISKENVEEIQITKGGEIVSVKVLQTEAVYKGYLYAGVENETLYEEQYDVEITNAEAISSIQINNEKEQYTYDVVEGEEVTKVENDTNLSTYYKSTTFNKDNLIKILGESGEITIKNESDELLYKINCSDVANESGEFVISYEDNSINKIKIITSGPVHEGVLEILNQKAIKGNTGYEKNTLKQFTALEGDIKVTTNVEESIAHSKINLLDTVTEAKLDISNTSLSTLQKNENIQLTLTLKSNSEKYDLWNAPYFSIQLPQEIKELTINSIGILYNEEMIIDSYNFDEQSNILQIQLKEEQKEFLNNVQEGIQLVINVDIEFEKNMPSKNQIIEVTYTNDNREEEKFTDQVEISINSKYGVVLYNKIEGFNTQNDVLESISQEEVVANLEAQTEEKEASIHTEIINNYETAISNVCLIGKLPKDSTTGAINVDLLENISINNENVQIYYAIEDIEANSENWIQSVDDIQEVKQFKVVIDSLEPGETLPIIYTAKIAGDIEQNKVDYLTTQVNYEYQGINYDSSSSVKLMSTVETNEDNPSDESQESTQIIKNIDGLVIKATPFTVGKSIQNGDIVDEGQVIRYNVQIQNNTGEKVNNFSIVGTQTDEAGNSNVKYFNMKKYDITHEYTGEPIVVTHYEEDESLENVQQERESIEPDEIINFVYEFSVNEMKEENEITKGKLVVTTDNIEETIDLMENQIQNAEIKVLTKYTKNEEVEFNADVSNSFSYSIENLTDTQLENFKLDIYLPEGAELEVGFAKETDSYTFIESKENFASFNIKSLEPREKISLEFYIEIEEIDSSKTYQDYNFYSRASVNDKIYYSNQIEKSAEQLIAKLDILQTSDVEEEYVEQGDIITYTTRVTNISQIDTIVEIQDFLPDILNYRSAYVEKDGEKIVDLTMNEEILMAECEILKGETIYVVIEVEVGENTKLIDSFDHYINIVNTNQYDKSNVITYKMLDRYDPSNPGDSDDDDKDLGSISGMVWLDVNGNGINENEEGISGIKVMAIDSEENIVAEVETNEKGEYNFSELENDKYIVVFQYNTSKYKVTKYMVEDASSNNNSDVISKTININEEQQLVAVTDEIKVDGNSVEDIDAGFYENLVFDMSLQKTVKRIIVETSKGVTVNEYNGETLAKIDIHSKQIAGANVVIEYSIKVTNEGEMSGYINEVIDYMPKELTFNSELNKQWYIGTDGNLHNTTLSDYVLKPGETKEVILVMTKTMTENNTGTISNMAEIGNSSNDFGQLDLDSVSSNKKENEDDTGIANVIISVSTGGKVITGIMIVLLGLIFMGAILYELIKIIPNNRQKN